VCLFFVLFCFVLLFYFNGSWGENNGTKIAAKCYFHFPTKLYKSMIFPPKTFEVKKQKHIRFPGFKLSIYSLMTIFIVATADPA